jgi:hypothetical protein
LPSFVPPAVSRLLLLTPPHRFAAEVRCYRQTLLDAGRWVHVAWTWDVRGDVSVRGGGGVKERAKDGVLVQYLFIDGKRGRFSPDVVAGYKPAH